jgi:hypothetical protein
MSESFFELIGGIAEAFGVGEAVKGAMRGPAAYAQGRATQTDGGDDTADGPYVYERVLTRPRDPRINDR